MWKPESTARDKSTILRHAVWILLLGMAAGCGIAESPKRARMATAIPSETPKPLSAPFRPTATQTPPYAGTNSPQSVLACPDRKGTIHPDSVDSKILGNALGFFVYLPPCYDAESDVKYPLLILFHGIDRTADQWLSLGLAEAADDEILTGKIPPMLIVLPYIVDERMGSAAVITDLLPAVEARYASSTSRAFRAIGGVSRGAGWALQIALQRPDLFGAAGMHSISPGENLAEDLSGWAKAGSTEAWPRLYFDIGANDPILPQMELLLGKLDALQQPYEKHINPGDHSDSYWTKHLREYLEWYSGPWK